MAKQSKSQCPEQANNTPILTDGELIFRVSRNDGTETEHRIDLLCLKLTCEQAEAQHRLQVADGRLVPTPEFLCDLAGRLVALGVDKCTPTMAWQIWIASAEEMGRLKKTPDVTPS